jgi:hypothetical protein
MRPLTFEQQKLAALYQIEGYDDFVALAEAVLSDSISPAICVNPDNPSCNFTCEMEPDQDAGWCEECAKQTMKSALVLGGLI